jgi:DNA-binding LytR/AlgR family response regulator
LSAQAENFVIPFAPEIRRSSHERTTRIAVKSKDGGLLFIASADVLAVVAQGNYVSLQRESGSHHMRESISAMADKLKPFGFIRIHRSVLVNKAWVEEIRPYTPGQYLLRLRNGKEFTVARTYKQNLKLLAEIWFGNNTFQGL